MWATCQQSSKLIFGNDTNNRNEVENEKLEHLSFIIHVQVWMSLKIMLQNSILKSEHTFFFFFFYRNAHPQNMGPVMLCCVENSWHHRVGIRRSSVDCWLHRGPPLSHQSLWPALLMFVIAAHHSRPLCIILFSRRQTQETVSFLQDIETTRIFTSSQRGGSHLQPVFCKIVLHNNSIPVLICIGSWNHHQTIL